MTGSPPPRKKWSYQIDWDKAAQVAIAFGLLWLVGGIVTSLVPLPYSIPLSLVVYLILVIMVGRYYSRHIKQRFQKPIPPKEAVA